MSWCQLRRRARTSRASARAVGDGGLETGTGATLRNHSFMGAWYAGCHVCRCDRGVQVLQNIGSHAPLVKRFWYIAEGDM
ncbi:MAG: hypothetical protein PVG92_08470 [Holophagae bacterium]